MVIFSCSLFSFNAKFTLYFKNNFKNTPEASENTSLVLNYVLSGNLIVFVLDNWILCCGRCAVTLVLQSVLDHSLRHKENWGRCHKLESTILTV